MMEKPARTVQERLEEVVEAVFTDLEPCRSRPHRAEPFNLRDISRGKSKRGAGPLGPSEGSERE
jgi:hypothetical protein